MDLFEKRYTIRICNNYHCQNNFSKDIYRAARKAAEGRSDIQIENSACLGRCATGPNAEIIDQKTGKTKSYDQLTEMEIEKIIGELDR